jgi:hypothetical protein
MSEETKSDRSLSFIFVLVILAVLSFGFFMYQYKRHQEISNGLKSALQQLQEIYNYDQQLQAQPEESAKNTEEVPAPSNLINFFTNQAFDELDLRNLKSEHVFNIDPPQKLSEQENIENISIRFKNINRENITKYIFHVEKLKRYIKLSSFELKNDPRNTEDVWDTKLTFSYRRNVEPGNK